MSLEKPVMIYDGECEFCLRWVLKWAKITGDRVVYEPYQKVLRDFSQINERDCVRSVQLVDIDGRVYSAAEAVLKTLTYSKRWGWLYKCYKKSSFFAWASETLYGWVARHR